MASIVIVVTSEGTVKLPVGGGSGALEKMTIPVTSRQVIDFTIGAGGAGGAGGAQPTQSRGNGTSTTVTTMYGQTLLTANGGLGSTGIDGGNGATASMGVSWWRWRKGFCKHFYLWHWRNQNISWTGLYYL